MKIYAIYDEDLERDTEIGYLIYYEKAKGYIIELHEDIDEWEAPLLFQSLVKNGIRTIPNNIASLWVKERVIPSDRQNIGMILKNAKLNEYNEMSLLILTKGKCAQDNCYIKEVCEKEIPDMIKQRQTKNIIECFVTEDKQIMCMFVDNSVRKLDLNSITDNKDIIHVIRNEKLLKTVKVGIGGYSIVFNDCIEIGSDVIREKGILLPITANDFFEFVKSTVVDTTTACDMLNCSRQNIAYLVKMRKILPLISGTKENMYAKGSIEKILTE